MMEQYVNGSAHDLCAVSRRLEATRATVRQQVCCRTTARMLALSKNGDCDLSPAYRKASAHATTHRLPSGHSHVCLHAMTISVCTFTDTLIAFIHMHVRMLIHIHTHTHAHTHAHTHMHIHIRIRITYTYVYASHTHTYTHHIHIRILITYTYVYRYMH